MKKKTVALLLALTLVVGVVAGGTIAWLVDQTGTVTNTFTVGDVNVELTETGINNDGEKNFQLIPGTSYEKDPEVTIKANSVACYLFVRFDEVNNPEKYLEYTSTLTTTNDWTQLTGAKDTEGKPVNVWYREVSNSAADQSWDLLAKLDATSNNTVKVKTTVVKAGTDTTNTDNVAMPTAENQPQLVYRAAAVQKDNLTEVEAWNQVAADMGCGTIAIIG